MPFPNLRQIYCPRRRDDLMSPTVDLFDNRNKLDCGTYNKSSYTTEV